MLSLAEAPAVGGVGSLRVLLAALFDTAEGMMENIKCSIDFKGRVSKSWLNIGICRVTSPCGLDESESLPRYMQVTRAQSSGMTTGIIGGSRIPRVRSRLN
jgi:hypothetical protein